MDDTFADDMVAGSQVKQSADWFFYLVAITIIVLIFGFLGKTELPAFGLATPLILAGGVPGNTAASLGLIALMGALLLGFVALGVKAASGSRSAFAIGLVLYAADTLIMISTFNDQTTRLQYYGGIGWHVIALGALAQGLLSANRYQALRTVRPTTLDIPSRGYPPHIISNANESTANSGNSSTESDEPRAVTAPSTDRHEDP
jgi:hypothetical protein